MPGTIVPYARFVEIRERRSRVAVELTEPPMPAEGDLPDRHPVVIDGEAFERRAIQSAVLPATRRDQ